MGLRLGFKGWISSAISIESQQWDRLKSLSCQPQQLNMDQRPVGRGEFDCQQFTANPEFDPVTEKQTGERHQNPQKPRQR